MRRYFFLLTAVLAVVVLVQSPAEARGRRQASARPRVVAHVRRVPTVTVSRQTVTVARRTPTQRVVARRYPAPPPAPAVHVSLTVPAVIEGQRMVVVSAPRSTAAQRRKERVARQAGHRARSAAISCDVLTRLNYEAFRFRNSGTRTPRLPSTLRVSRNESKRIGPFPMA